MVRKLEFLLLLLVLTTVSCLEDNSEKDGNETVVATDEGSHSTSKLEKTDEPAASTDFAVEKQVNDFLTNIVNQFEPGSILLGVKQILFFNWFFFCAVVFLKSVIYGVADLINLKRTPLLIYKEVDEYEEVAPHPAPEYPLPHKDYGYTGGFKTPDGEEIQYKTYHHEAPEPVYEPMQHEAPEPVYKPVHHEAPEPVYKHVHHESPKPKHHDPPKEVFRPVHQEGKKNKFVKPHHKEPSAVKVHEFVDTQNHGPPKATSIVKSEGHGHQKNEVSSYLSYKE